MRRIATEIARRLPAAAHEACFVGDCVRNQLLGQESHDCVIATSSAPEQIELHFPRSVPVVTGGKQNPFLPAAGDYLGRVVAGTP